MATKEEIFHSLKKKQTCLRRAATSCPLGFILAPSHMDSLIQKWLWPRRFVIFFFCHFIFLIEG